MCIRDRFTLLPLASNLTKADTEFIRKPLATASRALPLAPSDADCYGDEWSIEDDQRLVNFIKSNLKKK